MDHYADWPCKTDDEYFAVLEDLERRFKAREISAFDKFMAAVQASARWSGVA